MGWLGTGIGAGIGFILGGPLGAAIGAGAAGIATHNDDDDNNDNGIHIVCPHCDSEVVIEDEGEWICPHCKKDFVYKPSEDEYQTIFMGAFCSMLAKMAKADGIVTKEEAEEVKRNLNNLDLDAEDRKIAITIFNEAKDNDISIYEYASQFATIVDKDMRIFMYEILWDIAKADGIIQDEEDVILMELPKYLDISNQLYYQYKSTEDKISIDQCYELFECSSDCDFKEIKRSYRDKIRQYHPDTIQSKGLPAGFMEYANNETKKLNDSYDILRKYYADNETV